MQTRLSFPIRVTKCFGRMAMRNGLLKTDGKAESRIMFYG
jgi:hypothetical protein